MVREEIGEIVIIVRQKGRFIIGIFSPTIV
jgi:hypothetical protein